MKALSLATLTFLVAAPVMQAGVVTFDEPGYIAGAKPPAPWTDSYTARGTPSAGLMVYPVVAGKGIGGSQAFTVLDNPYFEGSAVYPLPTPLMPGNGPERISVMLDPSQNGTLANFYSFGGVTIGRGGWFQDSTAIGRSVIFTKENAGNNGEQATDYPIYLYGPENGGSGVTMGYFVPSVASNYYEIAFDINAAFTSILVTVTPPGGGTPMTRTTAWDGGAINKVWLGLSGETYNGQPVYYDNLTIGVPEPTSLGVLALGVAGLALIRRRRK